MPCQALSWDANALIFCEQPISPHKTVPVKKPPPLPSKPSHPSSTIRSASPASYLSLSLSLREDTSHLITVATCRRSQVRPSTPPCLPSRPPATRMRWSGCSLRTSFRRLCGAPCPAVASPPGRRAFFCSTSMCRTRSCLLLLWKTMTKWYAFLRRFVNEDSSPLSNSFSGLTRAQEFPDLPKGPSAYNTSPLPFRKAPPSLVSIPESKKRRTEAVCFQPRSVSKKLFLNLPRNRRQFRPYRFRQFLVARPL